MSTRDRVDVQVGGFQWVFASHQVGAAIAATASGLTRDQLGSYDAAWYGAEVLSIGAAMLSLMLLAGHRQAGRGGTGPAGPSIGLAFPAATTPAAPAS